MHELELLLIKGFVVCVITVCCGASLIRRGVRGDVWRSNFTGEAVVPRWLYVVAGVLSIVSGLGYILASFLLARG